MDIYIVEDSIYPATFNKNNEAFIILGNHNYFLNNILTKLKDKITFFTKYVVTPDIFGSLCVKMVNSSFKVNNKMVSVDEFITLGYLSHWCVKKLNNIESLSKTDQILIQDIVFLEGVLWKRILLIHCPPSIDELHEKFLTNPFIFINNKEVFNNLILRSAVNLFIFKTPNSKLELLINHILSDKSLDKITVLVNLNDVSEINLAIRSNDRNMFKAFVYAWFNLQLNNSLDDENVKKTFDNVNKLI
ncbi:81R protein [Yaba-like disease virus]|uniref:81R protein n=1 Tax=Yaba-like disease virus TaxID=132475 RepID=Q9DHN2_YLDV|nr:81R protein [Yaba-like disease virus]CAC21319.1 81R protein [Yaba-like disease virus]